MKRHKIGIVGAGNVGIHLAIAFSGNAENDVFLFSRSNIEKQFSDRLKGVTLVHDLSFTKEQAEIVLLAVSDQSIEGLSNEYKDSETLLLHTSGSISLDSIMRHKKDQCGVLYPLQSFSLRRNLEYSKIPFLIEASDSKNLSRIRNLVSSIDAQCTEVDSADRKKIHLSAVIVNNFVNHMYTLGSEYLTKNNLPFDLLFPLINETASRLADDVPAKLQTGPARRGDISVIQEHLKLLENHPQLHNLYKTFSDSIANFHRQS